MPNTGLTWGDLKRFAEEHKLADNVDIQVEIQKFSTEDHGGIPDSAHCGRVDRIEQVTKERVILTHIA